MSERAEDRWSREARVGLLADQVCIVTGAGQGLGRTISLEMATEGAKLALLERNPETVAKVADEIRQKGGTARKSPHAPEQPPGCRASTLVAGKQKAAGLDRFGEAATHRAQREGGDGTFRLDGQGCRFTGKFEAAIELQACLLKEFR